MILWLFCILAEKKSRNFKNYIAPGHLWRRPLLISAILNENIKSSRFALQKCGHNRDTEPNRLFLFCACMRVLIWMDLNKISGNSFMQGKKKKKEPHFSVHGEITLLKPLCLKLKECGKKSKRNLESPAEPEWWWLQLSLCNPLIIWVYGSIFLKGC